MSNKNEQKAFTSIRIMSKKAQKVLKNVKKSVTKDEPEHKAKVPARKSEMQEIKVHLSIKSAAKAMVAILLVFLGMWILFHLRHKILLMLLATFVAVLVDPGVQKLERIGLPRGVAIFTQYLLAVSLLIFLIVSLIPIVAEQIREISITVSNDLAPFLTNPRIELPLVSPEVNDRLTALTQRLIDQMSIDQLGSSLREAGQDLSNVAQESVFFAVRIAGSVLNFIVSLIVVLVVAFFMQMEKEKIVKWGRSFLPKDYRDYADIKIDAIHGKIGQWMVGELLLMLSIFGLTLVALMILRMPYALTLALLAGFCEIIPAVGPFFAAIPAILIAGTQKGIIWIPVIAGVYYVIQWCENNLLVPLIMKRAVGLSPIAILFAMMVGISFPDTVHPVLGVMLAVPATTIIAIFLEDWRRFK